MGISIIITNNISTISLLLLHIVVVIVVNITVWVSAASEGDWTFRDFDGTRPVACSQARLQALG